MGAPYPLTPHQSNVRDGYVKTVTIPNASMLTLSTVAYTLISASTNAQYAISPFYVFARISAGTAYTSLHDMTVGHFASVPTSLSNTICTIAATGFLDQTAATGVIATPYGTTSVVLSAGGGVGIKMGTGDPATGTSPMVVRICYIVFRIF